MQNQFSNSAHQQSNQMQPKSQNCPKRNTPHKVSKKLKTISQPAEKKQETKSNTRRKKKKGNPNRKAKTNTTNRRKNKKCQWEFFKKYFAQHISNIIIFFAFMFSHLLIFTVHSPVLYAPHPSPLVWSSACTVHLSPISHWLNLIILRIFHDK